MCGGGAGPRTRRWRELAQSRRRPPARDRRRRHHHRPPRRPRRRPPPPAAGPAAPSPPPKPNPCQMCPLAAAAAAEIAKDQSRPPRPRYLEDPPRPAWPRRWPQQPPSEQKGPPKSPTEAGNPFQRSQPPPPPEATSPLHARPSEAKLRRPEGLLNWRRRWLPCDRS